MRCKTVNSMICLLLMTGLASATIINVPDEQLTIQAGINVASQNDTVLVQPGTYSECIDFNGNEILVGSLFILTGDEDYIPTTIIDGSMLGSPVVSFMLNEQASAQLSGFTVQRGDHHGIRCNAGTAPTITDCIVQHNEDNGAYLSGAAPTIIDCVFYANHDDGIHLAGLSSPTVTGSTITYNEIGVFIEATCTSCSFSGNLFEYNNSYPVKAFPHHPAFFTGNTYYGNIYEYFAVQGATLTTDASWPDQGIPYLQLSDLYVDGTNGPDLITTLTLDPGVEVQFQDYVGLWIGTSGMGGDPGGLMAVGTEANPILFTSRDNAPLPGSWNGIYFFENAADSLCRLEHCEIVYGGNGSYENLYLESASPAIVQTEIHHGTGAGLFITNNASPQIDSCHIHDNTTYGIYCYDSSPNPLVNGCSIFQNGAYPVFCYANQVSGFTNNSYLDNGLQQFCVSGGGVNYDATWEDPGIPYYIQGDLGVLGNDGPDGVTTLTLAPGVVIQFENQTGLQVSVYMFFHGALWAVGTEADPIVFTACSDTPTPGFWDGIHFDDWADDSLSRLTHCEIAYGGYADNESLYLDGASPTITQTEIHHGAGSGIYAHNGANPQIDSCRVHDNTTYGIYCNEADAIINGGRIYNNTSYGLYCQDGSPQVSGTEISDNESYGIYMSFSSNPQISGSQIHGNIRGVYCGDTGPAPVVNGCDISYNDEYPVNCFPDQIGGFSNNTYVGNGSQRILVNGGTIGYDAVWEDPGTPYCIQNDLSVYGSEGVASLVLEPGVEMQFGSQVGLEIGNDSSGKYGALWSVGTETDPIVFTAWSDTLTPGYWDGIYFCDYAVDNLTRLVHCEIAYGGFNITSNLYLFYAQPTLKHIETHHSAGAGIFSIVASNLQIDSVQVHDNLFGISCNGTSQVITGADIYANGVGMGVDALSNVQVVNSTITGSSTYAYFAVQYTTAVITNCILWNNPSGPFDLRYDAAVTVNYSDIEGGYEGTGNIDADPLFFDPANHDYYLQYGSPCIDAGDPTYPLDSDGSVVDMGAHWFNQQMGDPVITEVTDVPDDQGRRVTVTWARSPLDTADPFEPIIGYNLWEMYPFSGRRTATTDNIQRAIEDPKIHYERNDTTWVYINYVPAMQWDEYAIVAETYIDSSGVEDNLSVFFVSAHTAIPAWYFVSDPVGGYSVDNIPPDPVSDIALMHLGNDIRLSWPEVVSGTFQGNSYPELNGVWYKLYGAPLPYFDCDGSTYLLTTQETEYLYPFVGGEYFFRIVVSDMEE